jgi:type IV secretory pathway ATPase VirB11/archaellum biosynthesis ATPase
MLRVGQSAAQPNTYQRVLGRNEQRRPAFSHYWTLPSPPEGLEPLGEKELPGARVQLFASANRHFHWYHVLPEENGLDEKDARGCIESISQVLRDPPSADDDEIHSVRDQVSARAFLSLRGSGFPHAEAEKLASLIVRNTAGIGVIESILRDDRVEDIYIDSPADSTPLHLTMSLQGTMVNCTSNIFASNEGLSGIVSRLRRYGGRPFSEAFPVLETEIPGMEARFTAIGPPISPGGPALAIRRHASSLWTLTRLMAAGMLEPLSGAVMSLLLDGGCTMLVSGPRGAGKTSLLAALMLELPRDKRIITIEDTLELPVQRMQSLGYKVQRLQVDTSRDDGMSASLALRTALRLGESAIVMGEVRGEEAKVLYESMRAGKTASAVLGTIHGDSAEGVYDRVVHDMGISPGAFSSTDVVVSLGLVRPSGGSEVRRSLIEISEYIHGEGFRRLAAMGSRSVDVGASPLLRRIAARWGLDAQRLQRNLDAREEMREKLLRAARTDPEMCSPSHVIRLNELVRSGAAGIACSTAHRPLSGAPPQGAIDA